MYHCAIHGYCKRYRLCCDFQTGLSVQHFHTCVMRVHCVFLALNKHLETKSERIGREMAGHTKAALVSPADGTEQQPCGTAAPEQSEQQQQQQQQQHQQQDEPACQASTSAAEPQGPPCFVITHSVAKRHNVGTIARCATAFGVKQLCLVGSRQYNTFGSHGSDAYVEFGHYDTLQQCVERLKQQEGCSIVGVEIVEGARPVHEHPFTGPTAFMLGNEGQGLSPKQMALCDSFVYIPQYGPGTASLNVAVACSIVLHHFAVWAGYNERDRSGFKFVVAPRQQRTRARGVAGDPEEVRRQRAARRQEKGGEGSDDGSEGFGDWLDEGAAEEGDAQAEQEAEPCLAAGG